LSVEQLAKVEPNYLFEELQKRPIKRDVKFRLLAQIASKDGQINDLTEIWPEDRKVVELGIISLESVVPYNATAEKMFAFNPLILLDGSHSVMMLCC
jgi:catalase